MKKFLPGGNLIESHSNYDLTRKKKGTVLESSHFKNFGLKQKIGDKQYSYFYLRVHTSYVNALTVLPDGSLASGSDDYTIK